MKSFSSQTIARAAITFTFFANGYTFGNWASLIPTIQKQLSLGEGALGVALFGIAIGAFVFMPITGILISYFESKITTILSSFGFCITLSILIVMPSPLFLFLGCLFFGLCNGAMDVSINTQASALERLSEKNIMSSFHAFFSIGGLTGSASAGIFLSLGISPLYFCVITSLVLGVGILLVAPYLLVQTTDKKQGGPAFSLPGKALLGVSLLAFLIFFGEGAIMDWSTVYFKQVLLVDAGQVVMGYSAFSLMMTVGRLIGDWVIARIGKMKVVQFGSGLAALGLGGGLLTDHPVLAVIGFGCVGLGFANIIPIIFSTAGQLGTGNKGQAIAAVATFGYFGFLVGPPAIGFTAELLDLSKALGVVVFFTGIVSLFCMRILKPAPAA